jgi:hypothetical protein
MPVFTIYSIVNISKYLYIWITEHKCLFRCYTRSIIYILVSFILFLDVMDFNSAM